MIPKKKRASHASKKDGRGRSTGEGAHVRLYHWLMESAAWRSLSPQARAVYVEIEHRYNGTNNGSIGLSARSAAELCNVNKDTATKAFQVLIDRGFIECAQPGRFSLKVPHASEWRLTRVFCDRTKAAGLRPFMRWKPAENLEHGPKSGPARSQIRDREAA